MCSDMLCRHLQHRETVDKYEAEFDHQVATAAIYTQLPNYRASDL
jgi:hypothetical protein